MKAVILAAGAGERLLPLTESIPKPMIQLMGKPIIEHLIIQARQAGIKDFVIVIGENGEIIQEYFADGKELGVNIKYAQQPEPKGVMDAINCAHEYIENEKYFLVMFSDIIISHEFIKRIINAHNNLRSSTLIGVTIVENPELYGIVDLDSDSRVLHVTEKPKEKATSNYAIAGIFLFSNEAYEILRNENQLDLAIDKIIKTFEDAYGIIWEKEWVDITWPWDLLEANKLLLKNISRDLKGSFISNNANISERTNLEGFIVIEDGALIRSGVQIKGPAYIGKNAYVGNNSLIRDYTSISNSVTIGFSVELKNSLIFPEAFVGQLSYIGDSIIGNNVRVSSGFQTWNYPFEKEIFYTFKGEKIRIPRRKFGTVIGPKTVIGMNVVTYPGTRVGANCKIYPGSIINKNVESNAVVKPRTE
ncbi:MAG: bifunctional sugar-1-phosphate nucleotidylyltransferase/acetyltransferase [Candidatus Asgardarchaeia archaeon]